MNSFFDRLIKMGFALNALLINKMLALLSPFSPRATWVYKIDYVSTHWILTQIELFRYSRGELLLRKGKEIDCF
jgi:hypothetical protein